MEANLQFGSCTLTSIFQIMKPMQNSCILFTVHSRISRSFLVLLFVIVLFVFAYA